MIAKNLNVTKPIRYTRTVDGKTVTILVRRVLRISFTVTGTDSDASMLHAAATELTNVARSLENPSGNYSEKTACPGCGAPVATCECEDENYE
jgi:hypothetical protein